MPRDNNKLSTSALARTLEIPAQQLFVTLKDYGWIQRHGDNWLLTAKGEYEGGSYQDSRRYGRYIVWPEQLVEHPLLAAIESNQRVTAAGMRRYYPQLHPRQINRALAELGLQYHSILGWELSDLGRTLGGQQAESESSGAFYVNWPYEIIDHPVVNRELSRHGRQGRGLSTDEPADDLFEQRAAGDEQGATTGIDGHHLHTPLEVRVCDWLYLAQLAHAYRRALPTEELHYADFYLPHGNVYIDCWDEHVAAGELSGRLHRRELYRELKLRHIQIDARDADRLDEVVGRGLLAFGIRC